MLAGGGKTIRDLEQQSGASQPTEAEMSAIVEATAESCNASLLASASTRLYESATLPAKQLGQRVRVIPCRENQQRQSLYDGGLG